MNTNTRVLSLRRASPPRRRSLGFSLVEIMVAALIGLIGSIVIFQVFAVSEGQKRTTTGSADAQQSGLLALFMIERDARMAGYGLNYTRLLDCNVLLHDGDTSRDTSFRLTAVRITDGASDAPDSIRFVYSNSDLSVAPVRLNTASTAGTNIHKVAIRYGYNVGDLFLAAEVGSSKDCSLQQVSNLPTSPAEDIEHGTGRYNTSATASYLPWSNTTNSGGVLSNLGPSPTVVTYSISGSQLMAQNLITSDDQVPVMEGIIQLQAQYGKDSDGDGEVDAWDTTDPGAGDFTAWSRIIAIRIALLARSGQFEKTAVTTSAPQWTDGSGTATAFAMTNVDGSTDSGAGSLGPNNWRNYRYRVFETTVPIRNQIWFPL